MKIASFRWSYKSACRGSSLSSATNSLKMVLTSSHKADPSKLEVIKML